MHTQDSSVQATTDDATISKFSSASFKYFEDPYLKYFVKKPVKRSPLINRGYYARVAAIRKIIHRFFDLYPSGQLVNFGAGLDTTYFWLSDSHPEVVHYELDFPEVVAKKTSMVERNPELRCKAKRVEIAADDGSLKSHGGSFVQTAHLRMVPTDLRDVTSMAKSLVAAGFSDSVPTFFLAECVLVYLPPEQSDKIIQWTATVSHAPSCMATYEQIKPDDAFGMMMVRNLVSRGCPLLGISKYPTLLSQRRRYSALGWEGSSILDMNDVYDTYLDRADVRRAQSLEIFDEIEEWRLIQDHYFILVAVNRHWHPDQKVPVADYLLCREDKNRLNPPDV